MKKMLTNATVEKLDNLIIKYVPNQGSKLDQPDVQEFIETAITLTQPDKFRLLVDFRGVTKTTKAARDYAAESTKNKVRAGAILIGSPLSRMIGNMFLAFNKTDHPRKLFTNEEKAIEWLKQQG